MQMVKMKMPTWKFVQTAQLCHATVLRHLHAILKLLCTAYLRRGSVQQCIGLARLNASDPKPALLLVELMQATRLLLQCLVVLQSKVP